MALPTKTFVKAVVHAGAETVTDQLKGTAVAQVGPKGIVRACFASTLTTGTCTLKGRTSSIEVIPAGSFPNLVGPLTAISMENSHFIYQATGMTPGELLELALVAAAASTDLVGVYTE